MRERDWQIFETARRQEGLVTYAQALEIGFNAQSRRRKLLLGEWIRVLPSVFRLYWAEPSWLQCAWAASLWLGNGGALSHATAALLHGIDFPHDDDVHATVVSGAHRGVLGFHLHHLRAAAEDVCVVGGGLRVTSPSRTLLDLLPLLNVDAQVAMVVDAVRSGVVSAREVRGVFASLSAGRFSLVQRERLFEAIDQLQHA